eukprot:6204762-Pleurochrysis_carterae.AAC.1
MFLSQNNGWIKPSPKLGSYVAGCLPSLSFSSVQPLHRLARPCRLSSSKSPPRTMFRTRTLWLWCCCTNLALINAFSAYPDWLEPKMSADFPFEQKFIDVYHGSNKSYTAYYELGPSDSNDVLILLHGVPTWGYYWRNVAPMISEQIPNVRIIVPDLMGMGRSGKPGGDYRMDFQAAYLKSFLDEMGLDKFYWFGHDWGGILGHLLAGENPERFHALGAYEVMFKPFRNYSELTPSLVDAFKLARDPDNEDLRREADLFLTGMFEELPELSIPGPEHDYYSQPFPAYEKGWMATTVLGTESPIGGEPADNLERYMAAYENLQLEAEAERVKLFLITHDPGWNMPLRRVPEFIQDYPKMEVVSNGFANHFVNEERPRSIAQHVGAWMARLLAET